MINQTDTHEENYLASVSDLMSGLIFIFIITLMVFSLKLKDSQEDQVEKINIRDKEIEMCKKALELLTNARGLRTTLLENMEQSMRKHGFNVKIDTDHGVISLPEQVLFPSGSNQLQEAGKKMLSILAEVLYANLKTHTFNASGTSAFSNIILPDDIQPSYVEAVFIEGHTDNVPTGKSSPFRDNWDLSTARSFTTYKSLMEAQPSLNQLLNESRHPIFSVSGYAEFRPVASNDSEEGRTLNRRIDIRIIMSPPKVSKTGFEIDFLEFWKN